MAHGIQDIQYVSPRLSILYFTNYKRSFKCFASLRSLAVKNQFRREVSKHTRSPGPNLDSGAHSSRMWLPWLSVVDLAVAEMAAKNLGAVRGPVAEVCQQW